MLDSYSYVAHSDLLHILQLSCFIVQESVFTSINFVTENNLILSEEMIPNDADYECPITYFMSQTHYFV